MTSTFWPGATGRADLRTTVRTARASPVIFRTLLKKESAWWPARTGPNNGVPPLQGVGTDVGQTA